MTSTPSTDGASAGGSKFTSPTAEAIRVWFHHQEGHWCVHSKYRFFRKVKTYGDRQAAVRFGLELPTGKKTAPNLAGINFTAVGC